MGKARKTIEVSRIKTMVNDFNLHSEDDRKDERISRSLLLERILHETNNYSGFGYLHWKDMESSNGGKSVGVNFDKDMNLLPYDEENKRFKNTDSTRVCYY